MSVVHYRYPFMAINIAGYDAAGNVSLILPVK